jgi:hypothetical protein
LSIQTPTQGSPTATGTASRNVDGQAIAITVFSTVKWWGRVWLPLVFFVARTFPRTRGTLGKLSFIHFARWTLVKKPRQRHAHLFFESNFNGGWEEYIDAFSHVLERGMKFFWGSSYGFPQPLPTAPFKEYIRRNEYDASHFYSAYPEATTTMVAAALELDRKLEAFKQRTRGMAPEQFAAAWREFLTDVQGLL